MDARTQTDPRQAYRDDLRRAAAPGYAAGQPADGRSLGDLIKELRDEATELVRKEVALAKTEISEKATMAGRNVAYLIVGGAVAYAGALLLLVTASFAVTWALIAMGMDGDARYAAYVLGPLLVGVVVTAIGYGLIQKAISTFRDTDRFVPHKTVDSMQENKQWAQSKI